MKTILRITTTKMNTQDFKPNGYFISTREEKLATS